MFTWRKLCSKLAEEVVSIPLLLLLLEDVL